MRHTGNRKWSAGATRAVGGVPIGIAVKVLGLARTTDLQTPTAPLPWFVDTCLLAPGTMMLPTRPLASAGAVPASDGFGS